MEFVRSHNYLNIHFLPRSNGYCLRGSEFEALLLAPCTDLNCFAVYRRILQCTVDNRRLCGPWPDINRIRVITSDFNDRQNPYLSRGNRPTSHQNHQRRHHRGEYSLPAHVPNTGLQRIDIIVHSVGNRTISPSKDSLRPVGSPCHE